MRSIVKYQTDRDADFGPRSLDEPDLATALAMAGRAPDNRFAGFESLGRSAMAHWALVAAAAVLGLAAGVGAGYEHAPNYTAEIQLIVGRTSELPEAQIAGLAPAVESLASDYARLVSSSSVISKTESALHTSSLPGSLTASPVPNSSVINVTATAPTEAGALQLANAGGNALVSIVTQVTNDSQTQLAPIIADYQKADSLAESAATEANFYESRLTTLIGKIGSGSTTAAQQAQEQSLNAEIARWTTQADLERLQAGAYMNQYNSAAPPIQIQQEMVQAVGTADYTGNNQKAFTEAGGLAGAVGGLVIGMAGAALVDSRRGRARRVVAGAR